MWANSSHTYFTPNNGIMSHGEQIMDRDKLINHFIVEHGPLLRQAFNSLKAHPDVHVPDDLTAGDLAHIGVIGLMKAASKWKSGSSDAKWHNFARNGITAAMREHLKQYDPINPSLRRKAAKLKNQPKVSAETAPSVPVETPDVPEE